MPLKISQTVWIEVAHFMSQHVNAANKRVHGHSLKITITSERIAPIESDTIMDFGCYETQVKAITGMLDHRLLNEIDDLESPTLELIAEWLGKRMSIVAPLRCVSVKVEREHLGQAVTWTL